MRTKSFEYCSKRNRTECLRARKTCSYRKHRTPKCKTIQRRPNKSLISGRKEKNPPKSLQSKSCSRKR